MSVLSLEMLLDSSVSQRDFFSASWQWLKGMPHGNISYDSHRSEEINDEFLLESINQSVKILRTEDSDGSIVGIQYLNNEDDDRRWTTEVVSLKSDNGLWISIKVTCDSADPAFRLPTPKKPYLVKMIMKNGWAGQDGNLKILDKHHMFNEKSLETLRSLLCGDFKNILPVLYISARESGNYAINPSYAARQLGGLAHVFVEPDTIFSRKAFRVTNGEIPYNGAVGLYWPDSIGRSIYLHDEANGRSNETIQNVYKAIITAFANRRISPECTWQSLVERVSKKKIQKLIDEKSTEINEYIEYVEQENIAKDQKMKEAEGEILRLKDEIKSINKANSEKLKFVINLGKEGDHYECERKNHVISFMKEHVDKKPSGWRSRHIIESIIEENDIVEVSEKEEIYSQIREALRGYNSMDRKTRSLLSDAGFSIDEGGRHYKLVWKGDQRYTFILSKSPSDGRTGKNMISDISKVLFG